MKTLIATIVVLTLLVLVGCGGSRSWKDEFRSEAEGLQRSSMEVLKTTKSAQGEKEVFDAYAHYAKELVAGKEALEGLEEAAPVRCSETQEGTLGHIRRLRFAAEGASSPKDLTPGLFPGVRKDVESTISLLRHAVEEARSC